MRRQPLERQAEPRLDERVALCEQPASRREDAREAGVGRDHIRAVRRRPRERRGDGDTGMGERGGAEQRPRERQ